MVGRAGAGVGGSCDEGSAVFYSPAALGFEGRFVGYDNRLSGIFIQPTVAYRFVPDRFSPGTGLDFARAPDEPSSSTSRTRAPSGSARITP